MLMIILMFMLMVIINIIIQHKYLCRATCDWNSGYNNNPGPNYQVTLAITGNNNWKVYEITITKRESKTITRAINKGVGGPDHNDNYVDDRSNFQVL